MLPPKRILLVDDDWDNLECVQEFLQPEFEVVAACGGLAGIDCLREQRFDAAVLDLEMPDADGFEVMGVVQRTARGMPVLLASAVPDLDRIAANVGAHAWLRKPFRFAELLGKLRALTAAEVWPRTARKP